MQGRSRWCVLAVGLWLVLALSSPAVGHLVLQPREVLVVVGPAGVQVRIRLVIPEGRESASLRESADGDGDGTISDGPERAALERRLFEVAASRLVLRRDDHPIDLRVQQKGVILDAGTGVDQGRGLRYEVSLSSAVALCPGPHAMLIEDAPPDGPGVVALQVRLHPGLELLRHEAAGAATGLSAPVDGSRHGGFGPGGGTVLLELRCAPPESRSPALD